MLIWKVSGASIQSNSTAMQFEDIGIIKEDRGSTQSMLIITSAPREAYMRKPISVRCSAFNSNPPGTTFSNLSYVVTYGKWIVLVRWLIILGQTWTSSTLHISLIPRRRGRGRRKSAWYTLYAHALNRHRISWRPCSYLYVRILVTS